MARPPFRSCRVTGAQRVTALAALRGQGGGALFIALMLLIVVSILGVAAARVTALQERMAGVYLADNRAFMAAEDRLRDEERLILAKDPDSACSTPPVVDPIPGEWRTGAVTTPGTVVENLSNALSDAARSSGVSGSRQRLSLTAGGTGCVLFRIGTIDFSDNARTSRAILQSTFIP
jgi:type IV pilus assembly protein PilX